MTDTVLSYLQIYLFLNIQNNLAFSSLPPQHLPNNLVHAGLLGIHGLVEAFVLLHESVIFVPELGRRHHSNNIYKGCYRKNDADDGNDYACLCQSAHARELFLGKDGKHDCDDEERYGNGAAATTEESQKGENESGYGHTVGRCLRRVMALISPFGGSIGIAVALRVVRVLHRVSLLGIGGIGLLIASGMGSIIFFGVSFKKIVVHRNLHV